MLMHESYKGRYSFASCYAVTVTQLLMSSLLDREPDRQTVSNTNVPITLKKLYGLIDQNAVKREYLPVQDPPPAC